jgi:hypothetical protein
MLRRKKTQPERPGLLERIRSAGCRRIAVVGLHPGAGSRTVVQAIAAHAHADEAPVAVTRAPRPLLDEPDDAAGARSAVVLPDGAVIATASSLVEDEARLEPMETIPSEAPLGPITICRVTGAGPVPVHGPDDSATMREVLNRLQRRTDGLVLVDGAWERRDFAAPDVTDGVILAVGSGYSKSPEHSAAAVRYMIETLTVAPGDEIEKRAWEESASSGMMIVLNREGHPVASLPPDTDNAPNPLRGLEGHEVGAIAVPDGLRDGLLALLVRKPLRCSLVVRDPTRLLASPVYLKAWLKSGGRVRAFRTARILAVATNPLNRVGPDSDPDGFRQLVSEAAATLPVHDVVLEAAASKRKGWKLWP